MHLEAPECLGRIVGRSEGGPVLIDRVNMKGASLSEDLNHEGCFRCPSSRPFYTNGGDVLSVYQDGNPGFPGGESDEHVRSVAIRGDLHRDLWHTPVVFHAFCVQCPLGLEPWMLSTSSRELQSSRNAAKAGKLCQGDLGWRLPYSRLGSEGPAKVGK